MTASALRRLNAEHAVISAMMTALEAETVALEREGSFDLDLARLILRYMAEYPDRFHHPKEEMLFDAAAAKNGDFAARIGGVRQQHDALPGLTARVKETLDAIEMGESLPRPQVLQTLKAYVAQQRAHIVVEENEVFPALVGLLDEDEWAVAENRAAAMEDPLAGGTDPGPYKRLQGLILP
jgi:hemerythrin-like domain-containing protein